MRPAAAILLTVLLCMPSIYAEDSQHTTGRVLELLQGYIKNSVTMQQDAVALQQAELTSQTAKVTNGYTLDLESGTMTYKTASDTTTVTIEPSAKLTIPQASGLILKTSGEGKKTGSTMKWTDMSFSATVNIISGDALAREVTLLKAQRTVLEARRTLQNCALTVEKEFYTALLELFDKACDVLDYKKDLYDEKIKLNKLKAQGYGKESSTYRTEELQVFTYQRDVDEAQRMLEKDTVVFAKYCGITYPAPQYKTAQDFLPPGIPETTAVDVFSFKADDYADTESALWDKYINNLTRKSSVNFTLSGTGGYTSDNTNTNSNSADIGATAAWKGLSVTAGVSLPVSSASGSGSTGNAYTLSVGLKPSTFTTAAITDKQKVLAAQQDDLAVTAARKDYESDVLDQQTSLGDIQWSMQSNKEEYALYQKLESDLRKWYDQGVITESDYMEAQVNRDKYRLETLMDYIDLLIYNDTTKLLFCRDSELK